MKKYIYIDYENKGDIKQFPNIDSKYFVFVGADQNPKIAPSKNVKTIKIEGSGKNAADLHIAFYLQKYINIPDVEHFIISNDKGFDVLVKHINNKGKKVWRKESLNQVLNLPNIDTNKHWVKVMNNLTAISQNKRPKNEKTLKSHLKTLFIIDSVTDNEIQNIINRMYADKKIIKKEDRIKYQF